VNIIDEGTLSMAEASALLPGRPAPHTLARWIQQGLLVAGRRVKLEGVRIGRRWFTSHEAIARFIEATTTGKAPEIIERPNSAEVERKLDEIFGPRKAA
jgi:hypothetical protein